MTLAELEYWHECKTDFLAAVVPTKKG